MVACRMTALRVLLFVSNAISLMNALQIASFNVQIFGVKKIANTDVMDSLVKVVKRYDIILIQEVRDSSDTAIDTLVSAVNDAASPVVYRHVTSSRLGRSTSKEQYSFLYRTSTVRVVDTYQYNDPADVFQREPFCVKFATTKAAISEFVLMAIHTEPDSAVAEMNELVTVHGVVKQYWQTDNILIMGDLNADCSYASKKALNGLALRQNPPFTWLINDDADTTTSNTDCAYDRFIVSGNQLTNAVVPNSVSVYRFDLALDLTASEAKAVSDHYPIELELRGSSKSSSPRNEI